MILKGRTKIVSEYTSEQISGDVNFANLSNLINTTMRTHQGNKADIDYLIDYRRGVQEVLNKTKQVRPEINNVLVINHAEMITRNIIGYFLGTPIQYIQNGRTDKQEQIDVLNRYVSYEDKPSIDKEIGEFQSICGTAYRIIYTDGALADEVPFEEKALNPSTTYVVYENNIAEKPLLGVTYHNIFDENGLVEAVRIYAYTPFGLYDIKTDESGEVNERSTYSFTPYSVGGVPIIEYPNNMWRIGDWELCIGLMDAINSLQSGRMDDIDQVIQSLLVFVNADIDSDTYKVMREQGVVLLKNNTGNPSSVDSIENSLDQAGMNMFAEELEALLYAIIGIPDRKSRSGGGGDTGQAVELRDGWADLEIVARNKELVFKKSEKQTLKIILNILNSKEGLDLSLVDVDIKFSRNKNNNLLVKTQAYETLLRTKTLSPADCLTIVDLVSDVNEFLARGESFWGDAFAGKTESVNKVEQSNIAVENAKNPPEPNTDMQKQMDKVMK
jgi:SPP1 family phage portal protein